MHSPARAACIESTIYGQRYLSFIIDEAHCVWKFNKIHMAVYTLCLESKSMIMMMATPVTTRLQVSSHFCGLHAFLLTM